MGLMTEAPETPLAPLQLSQEQLAVIWALNPEAFPGYAPPPEPPTAPERVIVKAAPNSRLEALLALYIPYKERAAQAESAFKELRKAIEAELEGMYPEGQRPTVGYEIPASQVNPQISMVYKQSDYLPTGKIKEFLPVVYEAFKQRKGYWEMREVTQNRRRRNP